MQLRAIFNFKKSCILTGLHNATAYDRHTFIRRAHSTAVVCTLVHSEVARLNQRLRLYMTEFTP